MLRDIFYVASVPLPFCFRYAGETEKPSANHGSKSCELPFCFRSASVLLPLCRRNNNKMKNARILLEPWALTLKTFLWVSFWSPGRSLWRPLGILLKPWALTLEIFGYPFGALGAHFGDLWVSFWSPGRSLWEQGPGAQNCSP